MADHKNENAVNHGHDPAHPITSLHPFSFPGPHVLSRIGGKRHGKRGKRHIVQIIEFIDDRIGGDHRFPEAVHKALQDGGGYVDGGALQRQGQAGIQKLLKHRSVRPHTGQGELKTLIFFSGIDQPRARRNELGQQGGKGHAEYIPFHHRNEKHVQDNIEDAGKSQENERRPGIPQRPQDAVHTVIQGHSQNTHKHGPHIDHRPAHHSLRRSQKPKQRICQKKSQSARQHGGRHQKDQRVRHHFFDLFFLSRSIELCHQDPDAGGQPHIQSHKYGIGAAADPHRRQRVRSHEAAHDDGIHDIIKLLEHISQKDRNGKGDQKPGRTSLRHIHLFCAFSCCQHFLIRLRNFIADP